MPCVMVCHLSFSHLRALPAAAPAGPVMVNLSGGEVIALKDDGLAPDLAAGDGIYSVSFTPTRSTETFAFSSPAGTENIGTAPVPAPVAITTATLPGATVGASYSQTLAASGGTGPISGQSQQDFCRAASPWEPEGSSAAFRARPARPPSL